ncbi:hypothetical protein [Nocardia flavorosea]|uniref:Uncharacterized protein n=1 Tax=Nocardia flavorosea TaxID=53429 RepID=A0A846YSD7_9NOCA|nr:hypothetical protein [Nocardia flavorosea]NKY60394.1 hypothetical protein [Nocardia flavorosea]
MTATIPPPFVYLERATRLIHDLPAGTEFVNADIYARMRVAGWPSMGEPRQFGPMLVRLKRDGWIEKAGVDVSTSRSHQGIATVWRRTRKTKEENA